MRMNVLLSRWRKPHNPGIGHTTTRMPGEISPWQRTYFFWFRELFWRRDVEPYACPTGFRQQGSLHSIDHGNTATSCIISAYPRLARAVVAPAFNSSIGSKKKDQHTQKKGG